MPAHRLGAAQQALRGVEIALLGRGFGTTDQAAFDRGDPLHRPRLPRLQLQCGAEREQRAFVVALRQQCLAAGIALPGLFAMIDALQVGRDPGILRPQFAQHRTTPLRRAQGIEVVIRRQRRVALRDQRRARLGQRLRDAGIVGLQALQREQQRDRRIRGLEQVAGGQRAFRLVARSGGIARLQLHRRQRPAQHLRQFVAAADADAAGTRGRSGLRRWRRRLRLAGRERERHRQDNEPGCAQTALHLANRTRQG